MVITYRGIRGTLRGRVWLGHFCTKLDLVARRAGLTARSKQRSLTAVATHILLGVFIVVWETVKGMAAIGTES